MRKLVQDFRLVLETDSINRYNATLQQWDQTYFLSDFSSRFSLCRYAGTSGIIQVDRRTPSGERITAIRDTTVGAAVHSHAVEGYIRDTLPTWENRLDFREQVIAIVSVDESHCIAYFTLKFTLFNIIPITCQ